MRKVFIYGTAVLTLLGVPPGNGVRFAVDRDTDGIGNANEPLPALNVTFSGGVHHDGFRTPDGAITIGRWQGGSIVATGGKPIIPDVPGLAAHSRVTTAVDVLSVELRGPRRFRPAGCAFASYSGMFLGVIHPPSETDTYVETSVAPAQ